MFRAIVDVWFIFAPSAGYILQVQEMTRTRRTDGYSLEGSLILLACNALRVIYFFGEPFAVALLLQSFVTIAVQLALVLTVLKINVAHAVLAEELAKLPSWVPTGGSFAAMPSMIGASIPRSSMVSGTLVLDDTTNANKTGDADDGHHHHHHHHSRSSRSRGGGGERSTSKRKGGKSGGGGVATWTPRQFLMRFIILFTSSFAVSMVAFMQIPGTPQLIGYLSMGVEATLVVPQLLLNKRRQSCEGLALSLVGNWILGDVVKTVYFIVLSQPAPFLACAISQLSLDGVLIYQLIAYRGPRLNSEATLQSGSPAPSPVAANVVTAPRTEGHRHRTHRRTMSLQQAAVAPSQQQQQQAEAAPLMPPSSEPGTPSALPTRASEPVSPAAATGTVAIDMPPAAKPRGSTGGGTTTTARRSGGGHRSSQHNRSAAASSSPTGNAAGGNSHTTSPAGALSAGAAAGAVGFPLTDDGAVAAKSHSTIATGESTDSDLGYAV
eukprot:CAMPEP_0174883766 /NCGR_PEP_ID=MMETSP1114-20130205/85430_1 /TAXON_ID=312471 /ORGANISM="Neobodo designis, Strain CCAP 1951/1" /LENGTH=493 /DNA_ID=CAMNT_0016119169 /DNA_START=58 /DNA_END=1539 /DNA_ORIENTATION=+